MRNRSEFLGTLVRVSRKKAFTAMVASAAIGAAGLIWFHSSREPVYRGKPLSFWCDQLPFTYQLPPGGSQFVRLHRNSTNQTEQATLREMERQALMAIDAFGTNSLPELLSRLRKPRSPLRFEMRKISSKLGFIRQTEVGIWHTRREQALTGILQLGEKASDAEPELLILKESAEPWLSAAASYALNQMAGRNRIEAESR